MQDKIIIITGPTASGKTGLAIDCALKFDGEIISADSMQIYKKLDIGTAKPTKIEQAKAKHHLIDVVDPNQEFSVQQFVKLSQEKIEDLFKLNKLPIITGGTGLYLKSLIYPYTFCNTPKDFKIREKYNQILEENGKEYLYDLLKQKDFESAKKIHQNDVKRVIRALEICDFTGTQKSNLNCEQIKSNYHYLMICLDIPREELYNRINLRVDKMFEEGLEKEIADLLNSNEVSKNCQSMQAIGYKEFFNKDLNKEQIKELIAKNSRNYAKRQMTFLRSFKEAKWFNPLTQKNEIINCIRGFLNK